MTRAWAAHGCALARLSTARCTRAAPYRRSRPEARVRVRTRHRDGSTRRAWGASHKSANSLRRNRGETGRAHRAPGCSKSESPPCSPARAPRTDRAPCVLARAVRARPTGSRNSASRDTAIRRSETDGGRLDPVWSHQINPPAVSAFPRRQCRGSYIAVFTVLPSVNRANHSYSRFMRSIW